MATQLSICVATGKSPLDATSSGVAAPLPGRYLGGEGVLLGSTACQALALQDADLDLGHVQPAGMGRRVVELDLAQQCRSGLYTEHFLEAAAQMRVEIVQYQMNLACLRIAPVQQPAGRTCACGTLR